MPRTLEYLSEALNEAEAALRWYHDRSPNAARALSVELDDAESAILSRAATWPVYLHGTRRYVLRRFPFSVVYLITGDRAVIVAVAHAKRRPGYWRDRARLRPDVSTD